MLTKKIKKGIKGTYPFHMPGHKRNPKYLKNYAPLDVTEIEVTDNLHSPTGVIKSALLRTTKVFDVKKTFYITGGSTTALFAAIKAVTNRHDRIILARNCHKSVWSASEVLCLKPDYVYPEINPSLSVFGKVSPEEIERLLSEKPASAVVITSPTYEGIVSDISSIAEITHKHNALLIVDSAHGAHLGFSDKFPESARFLGADIVIESAHKTLPCLTGSAMLHICSERVDESVVREAISTFMTSSPPYPLIYSLDDMTLLLEKNKDSLFKSYNDKLERFYKKCDSLKNLFLFKGEGAFSFDKGKIIILTKKADINGFELKAELLKKGIATEMAENNFCLCMTSIADTDYGFRKLFKALKKIDATLSPLEKNGSFKVIKPVRERFSFEVEKTAFVPVENAENKVSAEYIFAYPPGCPIIAPGEIITSELLTYLSVAQNNRAEIHSTGGKYPKDIKISL